VGLITTPLRRRAAHHLEGMAVERRDDANSLGVESLGKTQVRGNGTLALTADALVFAQWVPNRVFRVPRDRITEVTTARAWLGKTIARKLLVVRWDGDDGPDAIGLWVKDLDGWLAALSAPRADAPASP
jgi:hypothetical protein